MAFFEQMTDSGPILVPFEEITDFGPILAELIGPDKTQVVCDAIRKGNEEAAKHGIVQFNGNQTLNPEEETIRAGRAGLLRFFLSLDDTISESLVAATCKPANKDCTQALLDFGWPVNQRVYLAASLLHWVGGRLECVRACLVDVLQLRL